MFSKRQRLQRSDVIFILRRGNKLYGDIFVFRFLPQHGGSMQRKISIQISTKLDKRSSIRNFLKRRALVIFSRLLREMGKNGKGLKTYKVFIFLNRKVISHLKEKLESKEKTNISYLRDTICVKDFTFFLKNLGKLGGKKYNIGYCRQRRGGNTGNKKRSQCHQS